jgi:hypothetical protein
MKDSLRIAPSFIEPETIKQLSPEDQVKLVEDIRARRMLAVTQYLLIQEEKKKVKGQVFEMKFDKLAARIAKHIDKIDQELAKVEQRFTELRVLRLEAFDVT